MSRLRIAAIAVAAVIVAVAGVLMFGSAGSGSGHGAGGQPAPLFATFDLQGHPVALKDYRGHRVLLNFWASWCVPCRAEFPVLKKLQAARPDVIVLGVVFHDDDSPARAFLKSEAATWPGLRDPSSQIASAYGVQDKPGIPVSVLVGPDGIIRARQVGPLPDVAGAEAFVDRAPAA